MEELFSEIWNAPKEDVISTLNTIAIAVLIAVGLVCGFYWFMWRKMKKWVDDA